jgi:hypothetical protein
MVMFMIRTIIIAFALHLLTNSVVYAEEQEFSLLNLDYKHQKLQRADINVSTQEYEETYSRNRKFVINTLGSYSKNALGLIGVPEEGISFVGKAVGLAINGARLNLNKSETLGLELRGVTNSNRTLYFGVHFDW